MFVRPDRDKYIKINWGNIKPGHEGNFRKLTDDESTVYKSYDFQSIMHYGKTLFSKNGQNTIGEFIRKPACVSTSSSFSDSVIHS